MGSLSLPASGFVYVDTAPSIYSVEKHADYASLLRPLWIASKSGQIQVITSELPLVETLVGPFKHGDSELADIYSELLTATEMRLMPITLDVLRSAARLRADTNIKTPMRFMQQPLWPAGVISLLRMMASFGEWFHFLSSSLVMSSQGELTSCAAFSLSMQTSP